MRKQKKVRSARTVGRVKSSIRKVLKRAVSTATVAVASSKRSKTMAKKDSTYAECPNCGGGSHHHELDGDKVAKCYFNCGSKKKAKKEEKKEEEDSGETVEL